MTRRSWQHNSFHYWPVLFAFALPFGGVLLSWIIVFWALHSFTLFKRFFTVEGLKPAGFILPVIFFILTLISGMLSDNRKEGGTAIEVKLSFLLLPYLLFLFRYRQGTYYKVISWYIAGLLSALISLLAIGTGVFLKTGHFPYYMDFSYFLHPSYFSMYLCLGIVFLLVLPKEKLIPFLQHRLVWPLVLVSLSAGIFLCASKMGMVIFLLILPVAVAYRFRNYFTLRKTIFLVAGLAVLLFFFTRLFPGSLDRLYAVKNINYGALNKGSTESTEVRLLIWRECIALMPEAGFWGFGNGDINDKLYRRYEQEGLTGAFEHHLNAHNQYFQTLLGLGYPGFLLLLLLTLGLAGHGIVRRDVLPVLVGFVFTLNFCVESMLQTSAGNLCFVFIITLIMALYDKRNPAQN